MLVGIRGSGKSFFTNYLVEVLNFTHIPAITTRSPRPNEKHGVDYIFCTLDEFLHLRDTNRLVGVLQSCGNWYANDLALIKQPLSGKNIVLQTSYKTVLDVQQSMGSCYSIYIWPRPLSQAINIIGSRYSGNEIHSQLREVFVEIDHMESVKTSSNSLFNYYFVNEYCYESVTRFEALVKVVTETNQSELTARASDRV